MFGLLRVLTALQVISIKFEFKMETRFQNVRPSFPCSSKDLFSEKIVAKYIFVR